MPLFGGSSSSKRKGVKAAPIDVPTTSIDWAAISQELGHLGAVAAAAAASTVAAAVSESADPSNGSNTGTSSDKKAGAAAKGVFSWGRSKKATVAAPPPAQDQSTVARLVTIFLSLPPQTQKTLSWLFLALSIMIVPGLWTLKLGFAGFLMLFKPFSTGEDERAEAGSSATGSSSKKKDKAAARKKSQRDAKGNHFSDDPLIAALQRIPETITFGNVAPADSKGSASKTTAPATASNSSASSLSASPWASPRRRAHALPPPPLPASLPRYDEASLPATPQSMISQQQQQQHLAPSQSFGGGKSSPLAGAVFESAMPPPPDYSQSVDFLHLDRHGDALPRVDSAPPDLDSQPSRHVDPLSVGPSCNESSMTALTGGYLEASRQRTTLLGPDATSSRPFLAELPRNHIGIHHDPRSNRSAGFRSVSVSGPWPSSAPPLAAAGGVNGDVPVEGWQKGPSGSFHRIDVAKKAWKRTFSSSVAGSSGANNGAGMRCYENVNAAVDEWGRPGGR